MQVFMDAPSTASAAAEWLLNLADRTLLLRRRFNLALAGGSTPRLAYEYLAASGKNLDWNRIHLFWGDERCVPQDHPESNYRMVRRALLERVPIPAENIHRIRGELPAQAAAVAYQQEICRHFNTPKYVTSAVPARWFDLVLLGLGEDGHTASLFPGNPALEEHRRWVAGVTHSGPPDPPVDRVTLTIPAINASAQVLFLVTGQDKAPALARTLNPGPEPAPAARVQPVGEVLWMVDQAAAAAMTQP